MRKRLVAVIGSTRVFAVWRDTMSGGRYNVTRAYFEMGRTRYIHINPHNPTAMEAMLLDDYILLAGDPIPPEVIDFAMSRVIQNETYESR